MLKSGNHGSIGTPTVAAVLTLSLSILISSLIIIVSSDPGLFLDDDFLERQLNIRSRADIDKEQSRLKCLRSQKSEEKFVMSMQLCRTGNVSITCIMGGGENCFKDIEAYQATAKVSKNEIKCLIDANTTEWKFIQFVIQAQLIGLNEEGSRSLNGDKVIERQRGKCTLGYTCNARYLKDVKIDCYGFNYDADNNVKNSSQFHNVWVAPNDRFDGVIEFGTVIHVSYNEFNVDVSSAYIRVPN